MLCRLATDRPRCVPFTDHEAQNVSHFRSVLPCPELRKVVVLSPILGVTDNGQLPGVAHEDVEVQLLNLVGVDLKPVLPYPLHLAELGKSREVRNQLSWQNGEQSILRGLHTQESRPAATPDRPSHEDLPEPLS